MPLAVLVEEKVGWAVPVQVGVGEVVGVGVGVTGGVPEEDMEVLEVAEEEDPGGNVDVDVPVGLTNIVFIEVGEGKEVKTKCCAVIDTAGLGVSLAQTVGLTVKDASWVREGKENKEAFKDGSKPELNERVGCKVLL